MDCDTCQQLKEALRAAYGYSLLIVPTIQHALALPCPHARAEREAEARGLGKAEHLILSFPDKWQKANAEAVIAIRKEIEKVRCG